MLPRQLGLRLSAQFLAVKHTRTMVSTHPSLTTILTNNAAQPVGPYCQAIKINNLLFVSGNLPVDPKTNETVPGGIIEQTEQALKNLTAIVEASGSELGKIVKINTFLKNMNDFAEYNATYAKAFGDHKPARTTVEVARLPKDVLVEIECVAGL